MASLANGSSQCPRRRPTNPTRDKLSRSPAARRIEPTFGPGGQGGTGRQPQDDDERLIARLLNAADIDWHYEPTLLDTGLTGRGLRRIRPDFYLPVFELYIEVTREHLLDWEPVNRQNRNRKEVSDKLRKWRGANKNSGALIILVDGSILAQLRSGFTDILSVIMTAIEAAEDIAATERTTNPRWATT